MTSIQIFGDNSRVGFVGISSARHMWAVRWIWCEYDESHISDTDIWVKRAMNLTKNLRYILLRIIWIYILFMCYDTTSVYDISVQFHYSTSGKFNIIKITFDFNLF